MSTNDVASATSGTERNAAGGRITLPSFKSTGNIQGRRESQAESSTSGSKWSADDRQSRSPSDFRASSSVLGSDNSRSNRPISNSFTRRSQNRSSGGFLLESTTHSSRLSRALLSRSQKDVKGKRRSDGSDSLPSKRANIHISQDQESSTRHSPLSIELRREHDGSLNKSNSGSVGKARDGETFNDGFKDSPISQRSLTPSYGLDTDPAQIVDMALKLSEGRRRNASGRRLVSADLNQKRVISSPSSRQLRTPTKGPGHRAVSANVVSVSPLQYSLQPDGLNSQGNDPMVIDRRSHGVLLNEYPTIEHDDVEISRATSIRAEKARVYLELTYEHRRLLSHLPPVRRPGHWDRTSNEAYDSKIYNPLQYARNRKLRLRQKNDIDAEAEGWHDVEKVRAWVDAVISSHTETRHNPLECVRLPPLSLREAEADDNNSPTQHSSPKSPKQPAKSRRPKSDWVTHPGDLIADAYWLEQGLNKTKILDRDSNHIYPPNTPFVFSGWRNYNPIDVPGRLQQPTPPPDQTHNEPLSDTLPVAPELPTFRSSHKQKKEHGQGMKRSKIKKPFAKTQSHSRRRKLALLDSSDSSSQSDASSHRSESPRGRKRIFKEFDLPDGDPFDGRPISRIRRDQEVNGASTYSDSNLSGPDPKRSSIDTSRLSNYLKRNSVLKTTSHDRGRSRGDSKKHHIFRQSKDSKDEDYHGRSSMDDDSTAPNSPAHYGLPSIAINLDAPISRSPSPTKKPRNSLLQSLKDKPKRSQQESVDVNDFAHRQSQSHSRNASVDSSKPHDSSNETSRGTSPFTTTRGLSPFTRLGRESSTQEESLPSRLEHRISADIKQSAKAITFPLQTQQSRVRGMFKGGRIAELVGNEVSRVGDFIWKRDIPPSYRHRTSGSQGSFDPSDTDEDPQNTRLIKTRSRRARQSTSTQSSAGSRPSYERPDEVEKPALHNPNLPSFTSPFQRDRDKKDKEQEFLSPNSPAGAGDHISQQAAQHRSSSKSPRLDRLAPPKLDISAPRSIGVERRNSYGFGNALNRSQSASRAFNDALNVGSKKDAPSARGSRVGISRDFRASITGATEANDVKGVDRRDLARIESLLLISAVKAKNINVFYQEIPFEPSKLLLDTVGSSQFSLTKAQALQVRRRDQHVLAARNLIARLGIHSDEIHDKLYTFSNNTVSQLHQQIESIEDQIENTITPRVRTSADMAGELSVKLTTTSTQAVKSLQDTITEAFRLRRRGPFRWLRLLGYTIMEWIVVGLLWFIWAIVTTVRLFLGMFRITGRAVRWLLWIG